MRGALGGAIHQTVHSCEQCSAAGCMCTAADGALQRMVHSCGQCNTAGGAQLLAVPSSTVQNKTRCRPMTQFPYGWAPSEVFYNVPQLGNTPLK